jgi:hypothetical protein
VAHEAVPNSDGCQHSLLLTVNNLGETTTGEE